MHLSAAADCVGFVYRRLPQTSPRTLPPGSAVDPGSGVDPAGCAQPTSKPWLSNPIQYSFNVKLTERNLTI